MDSGSQSEAYIRLNKLETHQRGKLVKKHQNISNSLIERFKVQALCTTKAPKLLQEQQLCSSIVKVLFFYFIYFVVENVFFLLFAINFFSLLLKGKFQTQIQKHT